MEYNVRNLKFILPFLILSFFFSACSPFTGRIRDRTADLERIDTLTENAAEARELVLGLKNQNNSLKILKGLGKIKIWNKEGSRIARTAWIGSKSGNFRIEILSVAGQPLASLATDGKYFFFLSHSEQKFYKKRITDSTLEKFLSIPVKSDDVFCFLSGSVPVKDHDSASMIENTDEDSYILILKKKRRSPVEKIYLDKNTKTVRAVEMFTVNGSLIYRAEIFGIHNEMEYQLPSRIIISDDNDEGFQLDIEKYWANVSVSPSLFMLSPPN
jgi:hypothetical protein